MKKKCKSVLNIVVTLMVAFALMLGNVTSVAAYTDINGYPLVMDDLKFSLLDANGFKHSKSGVLQEDNTYIFETDTFQTYNNLTQIRFGNYNSNYIFPYEPDKYDYYLVGTYAGKYNNPADVSFVPRDLKSHYILEDGSYSHNHLVDIQFYDYSNYNYSGYSFVAKFEEINNPSFGNLIIYGSGTFSNFAIFSASIVPVSKVSSEADTLNSILETLTQINQNIMTGNTLQQSTIDAINTNTNTISNWFTSLISSLSTWNTNMTDNLRNWFYMIEERMSAGFTTLYHQMTKEQDEKLNGYEGTSTPDANEEFNAGSSELVEVEEQLTDVSNDNINNYTDTAFDASIISNLGNGLVFVVTWFTNFWNMGGLFTSLLNVCLAINVAFFILRIKGK